MDIGQILLFAGIGGVILFFWSGLTNDLPWGNGSVASVDTAPELGKAVDAQLQQGKHALFLSDTVAAIVVARPLAYYSLPRYFALELLTQVMVALFLAIILSLTTPLALENRLLLVFLIASVASTAIYFQYANWWGFSFRLALGATINLIIGWCGVTMILSLLILS